MNDNPQNNLRRLDALEDKAVELLDRNKLGAAASVLLEMLESDKNSLPAHFHLARVYRRLGRFRKAVYHARQTLRLSRYERNANLNLALIYDDTGNVKLAVQSYKRELQINSNSPETNWNLGRLYFRNHQWKRASVCLKKCYDMGFDYCLEDTVDKLAVCYKKRGEIQSYIRLFEDYIRVSPEAAWAYVNLGRALLRAGDYNGAVLKLSRAGKLGAENKVREDLERAKRCRKDSQQVVEHFDANRPLRR